MLRIYNKFSSRGNNRPGAAFSRDDVRTAQAHARLIAAATTMFEARQLQAQREAAMKGSRAELGEPLTPNRRQRGSLLSNIGLSRGKTSKELSPQTKRPRGSVLGLLNRSERGTSDRSTSDRSTGLSNTSGRVTEPELAQALNISEFQF